jgi:hypothetical protein
VPDEDKKGDSERGKTEPPISISRRTANFFELLMRVKPKIEIPRFMLRPLNPSDH